MQNKSLIEQQELVRYPRMVGEEYSELFDTICYKRLSDDVWIFNEENLPEAIKVLVGGVHVLPFHEWRMNREEFANWFNEVVSFQQSDRDVADCDGSTLLQKIQDWFDKVGTEVRVEASCN